MIPMKKPEILTLPVFVFLPFDEDSAGDFKIFPRFSLRIAEAAIKIRLLELMPETKGDSRFSSFSRRLEELLRYGLFAQPPKQRNNTV